MSRFITFCLCSLIAIFAISMVAQAAPPQELQQSIEEFVQSSDNVTADDVVNFLSGDDKEKNRGGLRADPTFGTESIFNSGTTIDISSAALSTTKFVVAYHDGGNSNYGTAVIGDVSGTDITFGSEYVFNSPSTDYMSVAALTSSKFVVAYRDNANSFYGTAIIGDVSGTVITFGSEYVFNSGYRSDHESVMALTSSKFVIAYSDISNSSYGMAVIGDVSGTVITFGSEYVFNSGYTSYTSVAALTSSKFVVAYHDGGNSDYGTAIIGDVSGTVITFGSEYVFNSASTTLSVIEALTSSKFVVAYNNKIKIGDVSAGTTITFGNEYIFDSSGEVSSVAALTSSRFVVGYTELVGTFPSFFYYGKLRVGSVSGNVITWESNQIAFDSPNQGGSAAVLSLGDQAHFIVAWVDMSNSNYGTAIVGDTGDTPIVPSASDTPTPGGTGSQEVVGTNTGATIDFDNVTFAGAMAFDRYDIDPPSSATPEFDVGTAQSHDNTVITVTKVASKFWTISAGATTFTGNYNIKLPTAGIGGITDITKLVIVKRDDATNSWVPLDTDVVETDKLQSRNGLSSFSDFGIGDGGANPLPVELKSFHAEVVKEGVMLHWKTSAELNNAGFYVYRAEGDLPSFKNLASLIPGQGTTTQAQSYTYLDSNVVPGKIYRYKISDLEQGTNNETFHSEVVVIADANVINNNEVPQNFVLHSAYPNPFNPTANITFELPAISHVNLMIYNISGKLVKSLVNDEFKTGNYTFQWNGENDAGQSMESGIYLYRLKTDSFSQTKQMTLLK